MKKIFILTILLSLSIIFAKTNRFRTKDEKNTYSKYKALSLGGNKLLLLTILNNDTRMLKKRPNERIIIYGKFSYKADEKIELIYDKKGYLKYIKGKLGYGSDNLFTFYHSSNMKISKMIGKIGVYASKELYFSYNSKGKLKKIKGKLGFSSDNIFYFKYSNNGRKLEVMYGKLGYDCYKGLKFYYDRFNRINVIKGKTGYSSDKYFKFVYNDSNNLIKILGKPGAESSEEFKFQYLEFFPKYSSIEWKQENIYKN